MSSTGGVGHDQCFTAATHGGWLRLAFQDTSWGAPSKLGLGGVQSSQRGPIIRNYASLHAMGTKTFSRVWPASFLDFQLLTSPGQLTERAVAFLF